MTIINLDEKNGLTLSEACKFLSGQIQADTLSKNKLNCIKENLSDNSELAEIVLENGMTYNVGTEPYVLTGKVKVTGNGANVHGGAAGFSVTGGDTTIENINFDGNGTSIIITSIGAPVENVRVTGCHFTNQGQMAIIVGSGVAGGVIKHVRIDHNDYFGGFSEQQDEAKVGGNLFLLISAGFVDKPIELDNCLLEDIVIDHNHAHGSHRITVQLIGASAVAKASAENMLDGKTNKVHNNAIKGVKILDNILEDSWDAAINLTIGTSKNENSQLCDVEIANNKINQGYWGIFMSCIEPIVGRNDSGLLSNIDVHDNEIEAKSWPGTKTMGIGVEAGRLDYYENTYCLNGVIEHVKIRNNKLTNLTRAIFIIAAENMVDCPNTAISNCVCRDILVENNVINECADPFNVFASWNDGRLFDWQSGIPQQNTKWGDHIQNHDITCTLLENNRVENAVIRGNMVNGYRNKYLVSGTYVFGHGAILNNTCEVSMYDNTFMNGEGHIMVKPAIYFDYTKDLGGNDVKLTVKGEKLE